MSPCHERASPGAAWRTSLDLPDLDGAMLAYQPLAENVLRKISCRSATVIGRARA